MTENMLSSGLSARPGRDKTFCEFFAGIGLVRAGLEMSSWKCIYANDIDPKKQAMYEARFGVEVLFHLKDVGNTMEVLSRIEGRPFMATASFPCIDLTTAGHYRGLDGQHSSAFFHFVEVLKGLGGRRPKLVLLENVPGLLTSRHGEDFPAVALAMADLGYWLDAFILDASHFVPQSRPRVFVVGLSSDLFHAVHPTKESSLRNKHIHRFKSTLSLPTGCVRLPLPVPPVRTLSLADVIDQDDHQDWWPGEEMDRHYRMMHDRHQCRIDELLAAGDRWVGTIFRRIREKQQRAEVRFDGLAGCLRTPTGGSSNQIIVMIEEGKLRMRWMSPREYARLQGAPDFPLAGKRTDLLRGFADAVCVPVIAWIDEHVLTPLYEFASDGR